MQNLDRRLSELERMTAKQYVDLVVQYVNKPDEELWFLTERNGKDWTRKANESQADFRQRAVNGATRNEWGVISLFSDN